MRIPRRIYDLALSSKAVSVYCYLCNRANREGECFPSVRLIATDLKLSKSSIYAAFTELEQQKVLVRTARYRPSGARTSNLYRLKGEL